MKTNKVFIVGLTLEDAKVYSKRVKRVYFEEKIVLASLKTIDRKTLDQRSEILLTHKALIYGDDKKINELKRKFIEIRNKKIEESI